MTEIGKEKRRFPRIRVDLIVRYKVLDTQTRQTNGQTKDISAGGICLVTREPLLQGSLLALDIKFPHTSPTLVSGRVIWCQESSLGPGPAGHLRYDSGIEFVEIDDPERQRISEQIKTAQEQLKAAGWKVGIVRNIPKA